MVPSSVGADDHSLGLESLGLRRRASLRGPTSTLLSARTVLDVPRRLQEKMGSRMLTFTTCHCGSVMHATLRTRCRIGILIREDYTRLYAAGPSCKFIMGPGGVGQVVFGLDK